MAKAEERTLIFAVIDAKSRVGDISCILQAVVTVMRQKKGEIKTV